MSSDSRSLLIVDDDDGIRRQLRWAFDEYDVVCVGDRKSGVETFLQRRPPVVLVDLGLPPDADGPSEGLATLGAILSQAPETKVIVMTGQADRANAVQAVAAGAYDFYQKPIEMEVLGPIVDRAYRLYGLEEENRKLAEASWRAPLPGVVATSASMVRLCEDVRKFAATDVPVLLHGESGTGKELIAHAVHELSGRTTGRFVAINCAAIPEQLLESELFGHEKGAFTGADKKTIGKAEVADGGTLFLDEVGDMSMGLQAKLLRFLQNKVIERVGGRDQISVDARVVSATNKDLSKSIEAGAFREDLYYRLTGFVVEIPPLRDRPEDAVVIANHLLERYAAEQGRALRGFTSEALAAISSYGWPGNVRELENRVKRAVISSTGSKVSAEELELAPRKEKLVVVTLQEAREKAEAEAIRNAMIQASGNVSRAARLLSISRPKLYDLLRQYNLKT